MRVNYRQCLSSSKQRGFTFLELAVVITVISALAMVALNYYYKLLVDIERTAMEHDLGSLRSAISIQVAAHYSAGDVTGLAKLVDSNPMDLLSEKPKNYLGVISHYDLKKLEKGSWFYDSKSQTLIYLVRNQLYFETMLESSARARFKIVPVYSGKKQEEFGISNVSWLALKDLEPYRWLRPWD